MAFWGGRTDIYHWLDKEAAAKYTMNGKKGFLNPVFFTVWSAITVFLWWPWEENAFPEPGI